MARSPGPTFSTILMPSEEEEDLAGLIWRNSMTSGRRRMKGQVQALLGRQALEPPWIVPSNLETLAVSLQAVFSGPDEILRNHTCLPAFLPFARPEALPRILGHVLRGESHRGVPSMLGLAGKYIRSKPTVALCIECVREDEERLGFAYWRRFHNLPGVTYCVRHRQPLVHGCGKCAYSGSKCRTPRLPKVRCWCGQPHMRLPGPKMPVDRAALMTLAQLAHELLHGALAGRTPAEIGAYYAMQARELGFRDGSRLRTPAIAREFQDRYSPELLAHLNATVGNGRTNWLEVALGRREAPLALTRNLLLMDFFGTRVPAAEDFKRAAGSSTEADAVKVAAAARRSQASARFDIQAARRAIESFLATNPTASRSQLLRALGRTASDLREFDKEWYEERLASRRGHDPLTPEKREAYRAEFDARTASYVRERRKLLLSVESHPKRLTRRALLTGCPRGNEVSTAREKLMPLTSRALAECVETSDAYKERYAVYVLETTPAELDRHGEAWRRARLPQQRLMKLVAKLISKDVG